MENNKKILEGIEKSKDQKALNEAAFIRDNTYFAALAMDDMTKNPLNTAINSLSEEIRNLSEEIRSLNKEIRSLNKTNKQRSNLL